ncbi:class I lanthipeptide [Spirosoma spitsbergense]|jgi:hypothetical protein|uniref:class I lanthipeptide n=1 Tax=Spirosoma spitsbergense TaxID=431554 RepID=UPI0003812F49|nr:class I lanthipeptide [Spirosoma spitsbergense]
MKKKVSLDKLSLDKETISRLDEQQLREIAGGGPPNSMSCNGALAAEEEEFELAWKSCCNDSCN